MIAATYVDEVFHSAADPTLIELFLHEAAVNRTIRAHSRRFICTCNKSARYKTGLFFSLYTRHYGVLEPGCTDKKIKQNRNLQKAFERDDAGEVWCTEKAGES